MTAKSEAAVLLGRAGGKAGKGASKRRGNRKWYQDLAKKAAAARAKKAALAKG